MIIEQIPRLQKWLLEDTSRTGSKLIKKRIIIISFMQSALDISVHVPMVLGP